MVFGRVTVARRSIRRDTECQFYFYSLCPEFRNELEKEVRSIFENSVKVDLETIKNDKQVKLGPFTRLMSKLFNSFL